MKPIYSNYDEIFTVIQRQSCLESILNVVFIAISAFATALVRLFKVNLNYVFIVFVAYRICMLSCFHFTFFIIHFSHLLYSTIMIFIVIAF